MDVVTIRFIVLLLRETDFNKKKFDANFVADKVEKNETSQNMYCRQRLRGKIPVCSTTIRNQKIDISFVFINKKCHKLNCFVPKRLKLSPTSRERHLNFPLCRDGLYSKLLETVSLCDTYC